MAARVCNGRKKDPVVCPEGLQGTQLVSSTPPSVPGMHLFEGHSDASRQACFSFVGHVVDVTHLMPKRGVPQQALPPQSAIPRQLICVKFCGQVFAQLGASAANEAQHESPPLHVSPGPHGIETLLPLPVPPVPPPDPPLLVPAAPPLWPPPEPSPLEQAKKTNNDSVRKMGFMSRRRVSREIRRDKSERATWRVSSSDHS